MHEDKSWSDLAEEIIWSKMDHATGDVSRENRLYLERVLRRSPAAINSRINVVRTKHGIRTNLSLKESRKIIKLLDRRDKMATQTQLIPTKESSEITRQRKAQFRMFLTDLVNEAQAAGKLPVDFRTASSPWRDIGPDGHVIRKLRKETPEQYKIRKASTPTRRESRDSAWVKNADGSYSLRDWGAKAQTDMDVKAAYKDYYSRNRLKLEAAQLLAGPDISHEDICEVLRDFRGSITLRNCPEKLSKADFLSEFTKRNEEKRNQSEAAKMSGPRAVPDPVELKDIHEGQTDLASRMERLEERQSSMEARLDEAYVLQRAMLDALNLVLNKAGHTPVAVPNSVKTAS